MSTKPTNAVASAIATDLFTAGNHEVAERIVLQDSNERDLGGWCYQAVVDVIAKHLAPAPHSITIQEARKIALDAVAKAEQERAAERLAESPAEEPTPPSPAEVEWPTEPGLWERGSIQWEAKWAGEQPAFWIEVKRVTPVSVLWWRPTEFYAPRGGWRRVPAAADVELAASQQECERLRRAMDMTDESCNRSIGRLTARIAALEAENAEPRTRSRERGVETQGRTKSL